MTVLRNLFAYEVFLIFSYIMYIQHKHFVSHVYSIITQPEDICNIGKSFQYIYIPCIYGPVFIEYYDIRSHHMQIFSEYVNNNSYNVYHYPILYFLFSMVSYTFIYSIYIGIRLFRLHFDITLNNKSSNSTIWNVTILDNKRFIRIFNKSWGLNKSRKIYYRFIGT